MGCFIATWVAILPSLTERLVYPHSKLSNKFKQTRRNLRMAMSLERNNITLLSTPFWREEGLAVMRTFGGKRTQPASLPRGVTAYQQTVCTDANVVC
jgi:hypothetical protein